ncbi:MAG: transcriptional repressor [Candidatus Rokubacteria bacterium]|nr:transcriptional repressor [Candidatus Rokubacteria bacterium]
MRIIPRKAAPAGARAALDALRDRGLRLTGPRRVLLEVVRATDSHPSAEWVHRMVRRRRPRVSLGTVYRNLRLLVAEGLVKALPGPQARFDGNVSEHHHFTCLRCGRIADVAGPLAEPQARALGARIAAATGHRVTHQRIEFFGRCQQCGAATGRRRPARGARRRHRPTRPPEPAEHLQRREARSPWRARRSRDRRASTT